MRIDLVTLFPELFSGFLTTSFVGKAIHKNLLTVRFGSPREYGLGRHKNVDDTPYGGGSGMVMRVDVLVPTFEALDESAAAQNLPRARRLLMTPQGKPLHQADMIRWATEPALMLICGRYEGFDERVRSFVDEEVSLGDFVMTGGEVAAMAIIEGTVRLLADVLGNHDSIREESHAPSHSGLLEYAQYTRPVEFRALKVPDVLQNGNHAEIARYRLAEAKTRTRVRRPDLPVADDPEKPRKAKRRP